MKRFYTTGTVAVIVAALYHSGPAQSQSKTAEPPGQAWLDKNAQVTATRLIRNLQEEEAKAVQFLTGLPEEQKLDQQEGPYFAMKFLATIRSLKAVPVLCNRLLWMRFYNSPRDIPEEYPAAATLIAIGSSAVPDLLRTIASTDTVPRYRMVASRVLHDILGKDKVVPAIAEFRVEKDKANSAIHQKRLDTLKQEFQDRYK